MKTTTQNIIGILNIGIKRMALTALAVAGFATSANAAVLLSSPGSANLRTDLPGAVVGYSFIVGNTSLTVSDLGFFDAGTNGLVDSHEVGIWTGNGANLLASVTVGNGTSGTLIGDWRYAAITPITLTNNTQYLIGARLSAGDPWLNQGNNVQANGTNVGVGGAFNSALTAADPAYNFAGTYNSSSIGNPGQPFAILPPNVVTTNGQPYPTSNFQYTLVPEPSTLALAVVGSLVMLVALRRMRRTN